MNKKKVLVLIYFITGILSTAIAIIGIFLPLIPTTPLLLLSAYCFAKSSQRFYIWLTTNRFFGVYIHNYRTGKVIQLKHKVFLMITLWLTICISLLLVKGILIRLLLILIAIGVSIHILKLKALKGLNKNRNFTCTLADNKILKQDN